MSRRQFLKKSALLGAGVASSVLSRSGAQQRLTLDNIDEPIQIVMGGYGPPTTSFSRALKQIGDQLKDRFGDAVEVRYVYNIMDVGYRGLEILDLVETGALTLGYQSSSYMTNRVPELGLVDLPFLFSETLATHAAMDGALGKHLAERIEAQMNYRILGYFENGFRHISNKVRPIRIPVDLTDLKIRVLPSEIHAQTFELLGADPQIMDLSEAIEAVVAGRLDAQENPFANTVTYGVHNFHKFHTETNHFYLSRPIFLHRPTFDSWPMELQEEMRVAITDAVAVQRRRKVQEEIDAIEAIRTAGGELLTLTEHEIAQFQDAVAPLYTEAQTQYSQELLNLAGL